MNDILDRLDAAIGGPDRRTRDGRPRRTTPTKIETALLIDAKAEIERLRELISATAAGMASPMFDLWTAVREPEKSGMSIDHALGHLAQALAPLRREALGCAKESN